MTFLVAFNISIAFSCKPRRRRHALTASALILSTLMLSTGCVPLTPPSSAPSIPAPASPSPSDSTTFPPSAPAVPSNAPGPLPTLPRLPPSTPLSERAAAVSARFERTELNRIPNVTDADLLAAWPAWLNACKSLPQNNRTRNVPWATPCAAAPLIDRRSILGIRTYWATYFDVWYINPLDASGTPQRGRLTGYYEPELMGSRQRSGKFNVPLARAPSDLLTIDLSSAMPELAGMRLRGRLSSEAGKTKQVVPYWSRAELMQSGKLNALALLWVNDPIEAFFLQVQGSGRIQLADDSGKTRIVRLGYADTNGHPYRSIGRWLVEQGELTFEQASMQGIQQWARAHPKRLNELLSQNPSYVFFRELPLGDANAGPSGALNVALTAGYSVAVDPTYTPLGAPMVISSTHPSTRAPLTRLVYAQDTGSAIRGPARVDLFWGTGSNAGELAGRSRDEVNVWMLLPKGITPTSINAAAAANPAAPR